MDNLDRKLLFELNWDCRQSNSKLAKKFRVSKQVIRYRILQLEKTGIIKSYHALINWRKLGYNSIRVYIKWHNINPKKEQEIYDFIRKDPFFMWSVKFQGDIDIAFYLWIKSIPEFYEKWFKFLAKYKKYILKQEIYESVNMVHYPMKPLLDDYVIDEKIIGDGEKIEYDKKDFELLKFLTKDARIPIVDIALKMKMTPKAVLYRLKKLRQNKIIMGFNALIDANKLGYNFYKIDFYLNDLSKIDEMFNFAKQNKNIVYRMRTIGGPDFEIEIMIRNINEMERLIEEIREKFKDKIDTYKINRFEYTLKQICLPGVEINS
jgi:Lrp/AsnC family transcriptional regulator, leucine-responsive regulatory protein